MPARPSRPADDPVRWGPPSGWLRQHFAVTSDHERRMRYNAKKRRYYYRRKARDQEAPIMSTRGDV